MSNQILIKVFAQKSNSELLNELKLTQINSNHLSLDSSLAIKTILANRSLSMDEKVDFDSLTEGEIFENIDITQILTSSNSSDISNKISIKPNYYWLELLVLCIFILQLANLIYIIGTSLFSESIRWSSLGLIVFSKISSVVLTFAIYISLKTALSLRDKMG
jgi:hypothetical protein